MKRRADARALEHPCIRREPRPIDGRSTRQKAEGRRQKAEGRRQRDDGVAVERVVAGGRAAVGTRRGVGTGEVFRCRRA